MNDPIKSASPEPWLPYWKAIARWCNKDNLANIRELKARLDEWHRSVDSLRPSPHARANRYNVETEIGRWQRTLHKEFRQMLESGAMIARGAVPLPADDPRFGDLEIIPTKKWASALGLSPDRDQIVHGQGSQSGFTVAFINVSYCLAAELAAANAAPDEDKSIAMPPAAPAHSMPHPTSTAVAQTVAQPSGSHTPFMQTSKSHQVSGIAVADNLLAFIKENGWTKRDLDPKRNRGQRARVAEQYMEKFPNSGKPSTVQRELRELLADPASDIPD